MRNQVFISYCHANQEWLDKFHTHLKPYVQREKVSVWDDTQIEVGEVWREKIASSLANAIVAVLLVTPEFLASDFISKHELPPLLEAAKQDGLTIIWVAVSASAYHITEIESYQAINNPKQPLDELSPSELNKELVRICQAIYASVAKHSAPTKGGSGTTGETRGRLQERTRLAKRFGESKYKTCNRRDQIIPFETFFRTRQRERAGLPHFYLIHGDVAECHDSLMDRLIFDSLKPYARNRRGLQGGPVYPLKRIDWVKPNGPLSELQPQLRILLFREFDPTYDSEDLSSSAFRNLEVLSRFRFVPIQQTIYLSEWNGRTELLIRLLEWYVKAYWGSIQPDIFRPQVLIFITIVYPEVKRNRWLSTIFGSRQPNKEHVKPLLEELVSSSNSVLPSMMFEELSTPKWEDVFDWFKRNQVHTTIDACKAHAQQIFAQNEGQISMAVIETALRESLQSQ